jgi:hypothetical protein
MGINTLTDLRREVDNFHIKFHFTSKFKLASNQGPTTGLFDTSAGIKYQFDHRNPHDDPAPVLYMYPLVDASAASGYSIELKTAWVDPHTQGLVIEPSGVHTARLTKDALFAAALNLICPKCKALPGHPCKWLGGINAFPHPFRVELVRV